MYFSVKPDATPALGLEDVPSAFSISFFALFKSEEVTLLSRSYLQTECFKNCENLKKINIMENKNDKKDNKKKLILNDSSFENCKNLEEVDVDYFYLGHDSQNCFKDCKKLKIKDIKTIRWIFFEKSKNSPINVKNFFEGVDIEKNNKKFNLIIWENFNEDVFNNDINCSDFFEHIVPNKVIYKDKELNRHLTYHGRSKG